MCKLPRRSALLGLLLLLSLLLPGRVWSAVTFDAVGPSGGAGAGGHISTPISSPTTWSHTVTGSNTVLYIACSVGIVGTHADSDFVITAVTFNSVAATQIGSNIHSNGGTTGYVALYRLVNPTTGANTVSVSWTDANSSAADVLVCGSISVTGADQGTPDSNVASATGLGTTPSVNVTSAVNNLVLDVVGVGSSITSSNQTLRWKKNENGNSAAGNGAGSTAAGAGSVTMSYAVTSDSWAILGVNINAVSAAGGNTTRALTGVGQ